MAAMFLHLSLVAHHATRLSAPIIAPAFIAVGCVALIPLLFFIPLPADAGEALHGAPATRSRRPTLSPRAVVGNVSPAREDPR
jgi:uncharacterized RDD family membrane protein YckC